MLDIIIIGGTAAVVLSLGFVGLLIRPDIVIPSIFTKVLILIGMVGWVVALLSYIMYVRTSS